MAVSLSRTKRIEELALSLINNFGIVKPAIDVKLIAKKLGVVVMPYDLGQEMSGVLILNDNKGTIGYNNTHKEVRARFTIAHELGHFLLHKKSHNDVFVDKDFVIMYRRNENKYSQSEIIQEQEANAFAAALLMPEHLIESEIKNNSFFSHMSELQLIEELSKTFKVSIPAMTFRLHNLSVLM